MTSENKGTADTSSSGLARRRGSKPGVKRGTYKKRQDSLAVVGVRRGNGKERGHLATFGHGLYFRPDKFEVDFRSHLGKTLKIIVSSLLDRFVSPAPAMAQLLAMRTAYKLVRASSYENFVLSGKVAPPLTADQDYLRLTGSIRADIQTLYLMSKDAGLVDQAPDLKEYLEMLKAAAKATPIITVEAENADPQD